MKAIFTVLTMFVLFEGKMVFAQSAVAGTVDTQSQLQAALECGTEKGEIDKNNWILGKTTTSENGTTIGFKKDLGTCAAAVASCSTSGGATCPSEKQAQAAIQSANVSFENLKASVIKFRDRALLARKMCLTCTNENIAKATTAIGIITASMDMSSQNDSCKKFGSMMDIAKTAMAAYNTGCAAARMACGSAAVDVETKLSAVETRLSEGTGIQCNSAEIAKQLVEYKKNLKTIKDTCDTYKLKLAAGAAGLINVVQSMKGAKSCENATASNEASTLDCSKPENAKVVECMCRTNPTLAGCAGGGTGSNDPYQNLAGDYSESSSSSDSNVDLSATPAVDTTSAFASESASGGGAGFDGGGGGQGGIAGNGSGKAADGGKGTGKGLNKNILSGYEGGSGGGKGGAGYSDDGYANQFKAFMPGGEKDPTRNPANAVFAGGQVTGAGSKSNWEKVSERYQANRPTMVGGQ